MLKAILIGNLGQDATVSMVNGQQIINFSVCDTQKYKNKDGVTVEKSTWVSCSWFTNSVSIAQYLRKGGSVYAEGSIEAKTYTQRNGQTVASLNMRVNQLQLLGGKKQETSAQQPEPQSDITPSQQDFLNQSSELVDESDGLPF